MVQFNNNLNQINEEIFCVIDFDCKNLKLIEQLQKFNSKSLKNFGLIIALIGFCLIYYIIRFYND